MTPPPTRHCSCDCSAPARPCPCQVRRCTCGRLECGPCLAAMPDGGKAAASAAAVVNIREALHALVEAERDLTRAPSPPAPQVRVLACIVRDLTQLRQTLDRISVAREGVA